ncbi:hypothetical protein LG293_17675 (plasmid) [Citricoccus nitrophenolicus]
MARPTDQNRVRSGIREGGQFAPTLRAEQAGGTGALSRPVAPALGPSVVRGMARELSDLRNDELDVVVPRLSSSLSQSMDYSDKNVAEEIDRIGYDEWGFRPSDRKTFQVLMASLDDGVRQSVERFVTDTGGGKIGVPGGFTEHDAAAEAEHLAYLREKLTGKPAAPLPMGTPADPVSSSDSRVQAGEVFDTVESDGQVFHRRRDGVYPDYPYAMRIQADRPISDEELSHIASLTGYSLAATRQGEPMSDPDRDTPYSFTVHADTTKGRQGRSLDRFEEHLETYLSEGSPVRKTDRAGAGTAGTRLIEGMGADTPKIELYYDQVSGLDD